MKSVKLCPQCLARNLLGEDVPVEPFLDSVRTMLPEWKVESGGCLRICPNGRFSMSVKLPSYNDRPKITLSAGPHVEGVVEELLSLMDSESNKPAD
jgi:hypothetical protein